MKCRQSLGQKGLLIVDEEQLNCVVVVVGSVRAKEEVCVF